MNKMNKSSISGLGDLDLKILMKLSEDDRISLRQLGKDLGNKSSVTIKKHIDDLEEKGIIRNYSVSIDYEKLGYEIVAIIELTISKGKMLEVERDISHYPNIFGVYDITGTYDALIIAKFKTRDELSQLVKKINGYEYVVRTNTHLVLNTVKEGTSFFDLIARNI